MDTEPVDKEPIDEEPIDKTPVDEEPIDKDPVDEEPIDKDPVDTDPVDTDPVDTDPVDTDPVDETPVEPEPVEGIIRNGLVGYWNSKSGVDGKIWRNISPNTTGLYDATLTNIVVESDGMKFNGTNSLIEIPLPTELHQPISATMEFIFKTDPTLTIRGQVLVNDKNDYQSYIISDASGKSHIHAGVFDTSNADLFGKPRGVTKINTYNSMFYISYRLDKELRTIDLLIYDYDLDKTITNSYLTTGNPGRVVEADIIRMGLDARLTYGFRGHMDSIRLYDRRLSDDEILNNISFIKNLGL